MPEYNDNQLNEKELAWQMELERESDRNQGEEQEDFSNSERDEKEMEQQLAHEQRAERQRMAKKITTEVGKKVAKKAAKQVATKIWLSVVIPILGSPVFWAILAGIFLIGILIFFIANPCYVLDITGWEFLHGLCERVV